MVLQFLEIDSSYRNRFEWPNASDFEFLIAQSGSKDRDNASDPVSNMTPEITWTSNNFNTTGSLPNVFATYVDSTVAGIGTSSDSSYINLVSVIGNTFVKQERYYRFATVQFGGVSTRILEYEYLGDNGSGLDKILIEVSGSLNLTAGDVVEIIDPTDFSDLSNPLTFVPKGNHGKNAYSGFYLYNETLSITSGSPEYRSVNGYYHKTRIITVDAAANPVVGWSATDTYSIRKEIPQIGILDNNVPSISSFSLPTFFSSESNIYRNSFIRITSGPASGDIRRINRYESYTSNAVGGTINTIIFTSNASNITNFYTDAFIHITSGNSSGDIRKIIGYNVSGDEPNIIRTAVVDSPFTSPILIGDSFVFRTGFINEPFTLPVSTSDNFEILQYSYDNHNPFVYSGSLLSQQEMVCYRVRLITLSLPNKTLNVGRGSRIAFYPYVYIRLSNVSGNGSSKNNINSNNPNTTRMTFRADIVNLVNPETSSFVVLNGGAMIQTIKFKPNDNLRFSVHLPNGELYHTQDLEHYSPKPPFYKIQLSAVFSIERVV